jgi:tape measure domain-containing protein
MVDIGQLRLVVDAETKGMERAMVRVQNNLKATETAMQALGKGEAANATKAASLEKAMVSLARKGLDGNHEAMQRLAGAHNKIQKEMEETAKATQLAESKQKAYNSAVRMSQNLAKGVSVAIIAAAAATGKAISVYADYEQAEIAFETMLGSAQEGQAFLADMWNFAKRTPFSYEGVQDAAKQMLAYGFAADEALEILESVGDAAAGLGGGTETVNRITRALGQMQGKGKVSAEEMRQLTEAGIPAWEILAEAIGTTIPAAMKLAEQGAIPVQRAMDGLVKGIGDRFDGLMDRQSQSLSGLMSTTKDLAFGQRGLFGRFGEYAADALKLHERIAGLNSGLEGILRVVESGGLGDMGLDLTVGPAAVALTAFITAASGKGVIEGWTKLAPAVKEFVTAMGATGGKAALLAAYIYMNYKFLQKMNDEYERYQRLKSTVSDTDVQNSFGGDWKTGQMNVPTNTNRAQAYYDQQDVKQTQENVSKINAANQAMIDAVTGGAVAQSAQAPVTQPDPTDALEAMFERALFGSENSLTGAGYDFEKLLQEALKNGFASGGPTSNIPTGKVAGVVHGQEWVMPAWMTKKYPELLAMVEDIRKRGYARGGPTSNIPTGKVAGVVHGQEWVMPAWMTKKYPDLLAMVEDIRKRGFARGGLVGGSVDPSAINAAGKAMSRIKSIAKGTKQETSRGDLFGVDKALQAADIYRLTGDKIMESLSESRVRGSDSMYNLGLAVANNSRLARDSAVRDFGNIAEAANNMQLKPPEMKLDTKGAIEALKGVQRQAELTGITIKLAGESGADALNTKLAKLAEDLKQYDMGKLNELLAIENEKAKQTARQADETSKLGQQRLTFFELELDEQTAWDAAFVALMAVTLPAVMGSMDDFGAHGEAVAKQMATQWLMNTTAAEASLWRFAGTLKDVGDQAEDWHWAISSAAQGGLEAFQYLSEQGANSMSILKTEFARFMEQLSAGNATWDDFGATVLKIAHQTIIAAEAQLLAAKTAAMGQAILGAFTNPANLLKIPGILAEAAAGVAALELIRKTLPALPQSDVPQAARGGIVMPKPGGTQLIAGEAGQPEAIIPLNRLNDYIGDTSISGTSGRATGGINLQLVIQHPVIREEQDIDALAESVMDAAVRRLKREGVYVAG